MRAFGLFFLIIGALVALFVYGGLSNGETGATYWSARIAGGIAGFIVFLPFWGVGSFFMKAAK